MFIGGVVAGLVCYSDAGLGFWFSVLGELVGLLDSLELVV